MNVPLSTALSGISSASERLRASAASIAHLAAGGSAATARRGAEPTTVDKLPEREVNPVREVVEQRSAAYAFIANVKVLQTHLNTTGALLDIKA
ncbi:MAG: hypothetical protein QM788_13720 [Roseateles sp.]|uniref:hypothetical protein n=1 Tax=Roseateles sp. TaxID=1971397 RepID=UPI0039ECCC74